MRGCPSPRRGRGSSIRNRARWARRCGSVDPTCFRPRSNSMELPRRWSPTAGPITSGPRFPREPPPDRSRSRRRAGLTRRTPALRWSSRLAHSLPTVAKWEDLRKTLLKTSRKQLLKGPVGRSGLAGRAGHRLHDLHLSLACWRTDFGVPCPTPWGRRCGERPTLTNRAGRLPLLPCPKRHKNAQQPVKSTDQTQTNRGYDRAQMGVVTLLKGRSSRSEEHTSELQSLRHLVCRLLLEKKN